MFISPPNRETAEVAGGTGIRPLLSDRPCPGIDFERVVCEVRALRTGRAQLDDQQVLGALAAVQRTLNALEVARAALVDEVTRRQLHTQRGEVSAAETLMSIGSLGQAAARRAEREAAAIAGNDEVAEALSSGSITTDQAAAVASDDVPEPVRSELLDGAAQQTGDQTRRRVRRSEAAHRSETDAARRTRQRAARQASMWISEHDGMWNLAAKLDPETGDQVKRRLERVMGREWRSDKDLPAMKRRTVPQRAADALVLMLCSPGVGACPSDQDDPASSEHGHPAYPFNDRDAQMIVTVELETLRNATMGTCPGASGGRGVGRASRTIPPAIRRALIARDGGCVWPGCGAAPIGCVGHHLIHWSDMGPTCLANLALLCRRHHNFLHEHNLDLRPPDALASGRLGMAEPVDTAGAQLATQPEQTMQWIVIGLETSHAPNAENSLPQLC
ncbi:HNH endonuclease signature motif containing protein [Candidatus Poriferisodalis sp.]|uniref:HNH endonuclease signature motif containing protein n=1 Tax=Candidatus Poriferisodalis sp. TaxID=3101277 RepID=UPI003C6F704C